MKIIIILIFFSFNFSCFSQEMYKIDYTYSDITQNTKCSLFTTSDEAVFKFYDEREMGMQELSDGNVTSVSNDELSKFYFTNEKLSYSRHIFYIYDIFYYDDYNSKLNWNIDPQKTKKIGKYNCTEAKTRINGRSYTVWFTFDVPMKFGPMKFHNLPGLVIEVQEDRGYFTLTFNKITKTKKTKEFDTLKNYFFDKKNDVYDYSEYEERVIEVLVARKVSSITFVKKMNIENRGRGETTVDEDGYDKETVDLLVDIPSKLKNELKKYHH